MEHYSNLRYDLHHRPFAGLLDFHSVRLHSLARQEIRIGQLGIELEGKSASSKQVQLDSPSYRRCIFRSAMVCKMTHHS